MPTRARAAPFTFVCNSVARPAIALARSLVGLETKSTAPISSASSVISAPAWVSVEIITTGVGRKVMILRRKVTPSMCGISTSSVTTSGLSSLMRSRATCGSGAVPTTSISGSADNNVESSFRMTAESSTMSTRTGALMCYSASPNR